MLTKKDLSAIKGLFNDKFDGIDKRFSDIDKRFNGIDKKLDSIYDSIEEVSNRLNSNTKELTDLILAGFATHEPMLSNHEKRIIHLEKTNFKSN